MAAVSLGLSPIQGVYSQSHAYGFTINLVPLRCLFSVSRPSVFSRSHAMALLLRCLSSISSSFLLGPATVSILDLTHSVTWFCYGYSVYSQSHALDLP
eukprot:scaffold18126_cov140-Skeletonema_marinoi.AAC.4